MNKTIHGTTNYKMLRPFLDVLDRNQDGCGLAWRRFTAPGYMDLVMEKLEYSDYRGRPVYYMAHYGEQNGDQMADPELRFSVDKDAGIIEPLEFRNDYLGLNQEVYIERDCKTLYSHRLRTDLDVFLWHWLQNIKEQGFSPDVTAAA